jgi:hypothetical protein
VFTDTLGLLAAWPMAEYPGFSSGGVYAGNINMEVLGTGESGSGARSAQISEIVFEPCPIQKAASELNGRGIAISEPFSEYMDESGEKVLLWTDINLNGMSFGSYTIVLTEMSDVTRQQLESMMPSVSGPLGGVGLKSIKEIVIGCSNIEQSRESWTKLFSPIGMLGEDSWTIGSGPAVHLVSSSDDKIQSMVWRVSSLSEAKTFLESKGMLGEDRGGEITIDPSRVQNLDIRLVEG